MFRRLTKYTDPILLIGIFISILISVALTIITKDTLASFAVGLLSTIIALQIDLLARMEKAERLLLDASGLSSLVARRLTNENFRQLVNCYEEIKKYNFAHYYRIADEIINKSKVEICNIATGMAIVEQRSDLSFGMRGFQSAMQEVKSIHLGEMDFWNSDEGQRFLKTNAAAIKRGVKVTRLFVLGPEEVLNYSKVLLTQKKLGVNVLIMPPGPLDHEFVITDNRILVNYEIDETKKAGNESKIEQIILDPVLVNKKIAEYQNFVDRYAKPFRKESMVS